MTDKQDPIAHAARLLREAAEELRQAEQYDHGDPAAHGNAWKAAVCTELRRLAKLEAQIEALSGMQAQSAPAAAAGPSLRHLHDLLYTAQRTTGDAQAQAIAEARIALSGIMTAQEPAVLASRAWPKVSGVSRDEGHSRALLVFFAAEPTDDEVRAVHDTLAASPTPPAEQQARYSRLHDADALHGKQLSVYGTATTTGAALGGVYAELPRAGAIGYASVVDVDSYVTRMTIGPRLPGVRDIALWTTDQLRDFADRTHALRMEQAASKAAPVKACVCGEPQAPGTVHRVDGPCYVAAPQQAAPKAAPVESDYSKWDAELGRTAMRFVDRAGDVHPGIDDAETICAEFHKAMSEVIERMPHVQRMAAPQQEPASTIRVGWGRDYQDNGKPIDASAAPVPNLAAAPQQEAQEPCQTCIAMARTVMLDQVSFDRKPDCYGIRQITDDDGIEEWEDIRTSPDVAREEANDMMATGRGEIYEVVPLWTTPQPAPLSDEVVKDAARLDWLALAGPTSICVVIDRPHDSEVEVATDDVTGYGKTLREALDAALAAQGGKDAG